MLELEMNPSGRNWDSLASSQPLEAALTQDKDCNRQPEHRQQNPEDDDQAS
jgi:hypothetical protein